MTDQTFTTPRPVRFEVRVPSGDVDVTTTGDGVSEVALSGSPRLVEAATVELVGDRLVVELPRRGLNFFTTMTGRLKVQARVPERSSVEIASAAGAASLQGTFAALDLKSASGGLRLAGEVVGDATVKTVSGEVRLGRVGGDLDAQVVSGDVSAEAVGGSVSVKSVSGDVRVGSLREGRASIHSVSGDVELGIAPGTNVDVDAGTASGRLHADMPLAQVPDGTEGPTVVIRGKTVSGDFRVFRAAA